MKFLLSIVFLLWLWVLPATLATGVIAGLVALTGGQWPWYLWVLLLPLLYACWLVLFLFFCGPGIRRLGRRHPKPRHASVPSRDRGMITVMACSLRMHLITSLPLVPLLQHTDWGRKLVLGSYAPSIHIGRGAQIAGRLTDPDLTEIGEFVTVGGNSNIVAHLWMASPSGKRDYFTAPVKIGRHAMLGGGVGIMLGCTVGEYAVLQPLSYLPPHTEVPAGEIWGGNPACFQAKRKGIPKAGAGEAEAGAAGAKGS